MLAKYLRRQQTPYFVSNYAGISYDVNSRLLYLAHMSTKLSFALKVAGVLWAITLIVGYSIPNKTLAASSENTITGIASFSGHPVKGITPWATCQGHKQHATNPTDANGRYTIIFAASDCPIGSTAKVNVYEKIAGGGTYIGSNTVVITGEVTNLDIVAFEPVGVPEYSWVTGNVAAVGGAVWIFIRRKALLKRPKSY